MDELAYKSSNTRKANQFSWKIIHNTIYTEAKLKKNRIYERFMPFFLYIFELKLGNIYFTTVQSYNKIISVLKNYMVLR
jgi:hypothetical protein